MLYKKEQKTSKAYVLRQMDDYFYLNHIPGVCIKLK